MKIAVITGASSGMGRSFVLKLDEKYAFDEIWVVARRRDRLESLSGMTRARIRPIALDLSKKESIDEYRELLLAEKPDVDTLVCAAGFGRFGAFADIPLETELDMIDLNVKALVAVTYETLKYMKKGAKIYELDSLSAFQPVPYINVYGATKAFVLSFSRALGTELRPRGIRVMAVSPGWVKTEFFDHAVTDNTIIYYNKYFTADEVVVRALRDMERGKDVSVCGASVRAQVRLTKILPHRLVMKIWCRQQKKPY